MITPPELARLEEPRQAIGTAEISLESEAIAGGMMCFGGKGSWANQANGLGLDGPVSKEEIARLVDFYVSRGHEPCIEVADCADESLLVQLEAHGFTLVEFEHVWYREIDPEEDLKQAMPHPLPEGLTVERVDPEDEAGVDEFIRASSSGFLKEGETLPQSNYDLGKRMIQHPRSAGFTAKIDGVVVGGGAMEVTPETAASVPIPIAESAEMATLAPIPTAWFSDILPEAPMRTE